LDTLSGQSAHFVTVPSVIAPHSNGKEQEGFEALMANLRDSITSTVERRIDEVVSSAVDRAIDRAFAPGGVASRHIYGALNLLDAGSSDRSDDKLPTPPETAEPDKDGLKLSDYLAKMFSRSEYGLKSILKNQNTAFQDSERLSSVLNRLCDANTQLQLSLTETLSKGVDEFKKAGIAEHLEAAIISEGRSTTEAVLRIVGRALAPSPTPPPAQLPNSASPSRPAFPNSRILYPIRPDARSGAGPNSGSSSPSSTSIDLPAPGFSTSQVFGPRPPSPCYSDAGSDVELLDYDVPSSMSPVTKQHADAESKFKPDSDDEEGTDVEDSKSGSEILGLSCNNSQKSQQRFSSRSAQAGVQENIDWEL
jgi:hypothetical protein